MAAVSKNRLPITCVMRIWALRLLCRRRFSWWVVSRYGTSTLILVCSAEYVTTDRWFDDHIHTDYSTPVLLYEALSQGLRSIPRFCPPLNMMNHGRFTSKMELISFDHRLQLRLRQEETSFFKLLQILMIKFWIGLHRTFPNSSSDH